jgi:hypothetical protein
VVFDGGPARRRRRAAVLFVASGASRAPASKGR